MGNASYLGRGVKYVIRTPEVFQMIKCPLIVSTLICIFVLAVLLGGALSPLAGAIETDGLTAGWSFFVSFFITLVEVNLITFVAFIILYGQLDARVFNTVYEAQAAADARAHLQETTDKSCCCGCTWFGVFQVLIVLVTLPLNVVPIIGNLIWALINGFHYAFGLHKHYMRRHGVKKFTSKLRVATSSSFYPVFGTLAALSLLTPVLGPFFVFASAAGAALHAAEKEPALAYLKKHDQWDGPVGTSTEPNQPHEASKAQDGKDVAQV